MRDFSNVRLRDWATSEIVREANVGKASGLARFAKNVGTRDSAKAGGLRYVGKASGLARFAKNVGSREPAKAGGLRYKLRCNLRHVVSR